MTAYLCQHSDLIVAMVATTRLATAFVSFVLLLGFRFGVVSRGCCLHPVCLDKTRGLEMWGRFYFGPTLGGKFLEKARFAFGVLGLAEESFQFVDAKDAIAQALKRISDSKRQVGRKLHYVRKSLPHGLLRAKKSLKITIAGVLRILTHHPSLISAPVTGAF